MEKNILEGISIEEYLNIVKAGPGQYIFREHVLEDSGKIIKKLGNKAYISAGNKAWNAIADRFVPSIEGVGIQYELNMFLGESTEKNMQDLIDGAKEFGADFIIGVGGGKSLDTAKVAADMLNIPVVTIPTIAATCACSSPLCIIYSEEGSWLRNYYPKTNPNIVLADPKVLVDAPIQYIKSGMIDSLAKWYEGSLSMKSSDNANMFDHIALNMAKGLGEDMFAIAKEAIDAVKNADQRNEAFLDVVNLNLYVAGTIQALGVKAVRNGIAHSVHNGLTAMHESHNLTHGIKVGYGIAAQLILMEESEEEVVKFVEFCKIMEFTPTFKGLNLNFIEENIQLVAQKTIESTDMQRAPFDKITGKMVEKAIKDLEINTLVNA